MSKILELREKRAKAWDAAKQFLDAKRGADGMAEAELDRFSRNGSTFYLNTRLFASPAAGHKEDMMQALKEQGFGSIVVETVKPAPSFILFSSKSLLIMKFTTFIPLFLYYPSLELATLNISS